MKDFKEIKSRVKEYTPELAKKKFEEAHAQWSSLPEEDRGKFNASWLQKNGYGGLNVWLNKKYPTQEAIDVFLSSLVPEAQNSFEERLIYTESSVKEKLIEAYQKWNEQILETKGKFNKGWLNRNGYAAIYAWMEREGGGTEEFIERHQLDEIRQALDIRKSPEVKKYDINLALKQLIDAYSQWQSLPEENRPDFNSRWFRKAGYPSLDNWCRKNLENGVSSLLALAPIEVRTRFSVSEKRKEVKLQDIVQDIILAHQTWKKTPENLRGRFNSFWLSNNGFGRIVNWAGTHYQGKGRLTALMEFVPTEVKLDFDRRELVDPIEEISRNAEQYVAEIAYNTNIDSEVFKKIIAFCGSSRVLDVLFKFRPEYKKIPIDKVKKILGEYLGDFLAMRRSFELRDVAEIAPYLSELSLREGLYETLKRDCLNFYYRIRREGSIQNDKEVVEMYFNHVVQELGGIDSKDVHDVMVEALTYFESLFSTVGKPAAMIDQLSEGREFPDVNQRINTKELEHKKRMLIADEMGLGKSGSVIFAKESLCIKRAIVAVPSNVIDTWRNYLSDDRQRGGYFKEGQAPRVYIMDDPKVLETIDLNAYDYILISHERLETNYVAALKRSASDMLIVDEAHKLKKLEGKRSEQLQELAKTMQGEDKYLALLSGTPVPNTVQDIGITLKLLYPERFEAMDNTTLKQQIIRGDILDLRSLLLPRMQMKELRDSVEMPPLNEEIEYIHLSPLEQEVYEVLLEEDEVEAHEKMHALRKFLLNPELVDPTPGIEGTKITQLREELQRLFKTKDKVVVFFNEYIERVIRGDNNIATQLGLPADIRIEIIHGKNPNERKAIQNRFQKENGKVLLLVSGDTADVGVDFTAGEEVLFYNEPWTVYEKKQQLARVYRPGFHQESLHARTFLFEGTIEQGIHEHALAKYHAVEKLLKGIPLNEIEEYLLQSDKKEINIDGEVNPELAKYYFSSWDRLMKIFAYVKEIGEEQFTQFLSKYSKEYAEAYQDLGSRSYQSNANRVSATILEKMIREKGESPSTIRILDAASGPEMLKRHIKEEFQQSVVSMDLNTLHFEPDNQTRFIGSFLDMPFQENSFDYVNLSLAWHYTNFAPKKEKYERLQVLQQINTVLKEGGRAVINQIYSLDIRDMNKFRQIAELIGLSVVESCSGEAGSGDRYQSRIITLEKTKSVHLNIEELVTAIKEQDLADGLKFKRTEKGLKDSRRILTEFELNEQKVKIELNQNDQAILAEEEAVVDRGNALKQQYKNIQSIPRSEIEKEKFVRVFNGKRYILFKKLSTGPGAVVVK